MNDDARPPLSDNGHSTVTHSHGEGTKEVEVTPPNDTGEAGDGGSKVTPPNETGEASGGESELQHEEGECSSDEDGGGQLSTGNRNNDSRKEDTVRNAQIIVCTPNQLVTEKAQPSQATSSKSMAAPSGSKAGSVQKKVTDYMKGSHRSVNKASSSAQSTPKQVPSSARSTARQVPPTINPQASNPMIIEPLKCDSYDKLRYRRSQLTILSESDLEQWMNNVLTQCSLQNLMLIDTSTALKLFNTYAKVRYASESALMSPQAYSAFQIRKYIDTRDGKVSWGCQRCAHHYDSVWMAIYHAEIHIVDMVCTMKKADGSECRDKHKASRAMIEHFFVDHIRPELILAYRAYVGTLTQEPGPQVTEPHREVPVSKKRKGY